MWQPDGWSTEQVLKVKVRDKPRRWVRFDRLVMSTQGVSREGPPSNMAIAKKTYDVRNNRTIEIAEGSQKVCRRLREPMSLVTVFEVALWYDGQNREELLDFVGTASDTNDEKHWIPANLRNSNRDKILSSLLRRI